MDLRHLLIASAIATTTGCVHHAASVPLAHNQVATSPAVGLRHARSLARGRLTYDVVFSSTGDALTAIELGLAFKLVRHPLAPQPVARKHSAARLGDPTYDVTSVALGPNARTAWVASLDGSVRRFDLVTGHMQTRWPIGESVSALDVSTDGTRLILGTTNGVLCLRRTSDAALLQCVVAHSARISAARFSRDGTKLVTSSWDGGVVLWSVPSLAIIARSSSSGSANDVAFSPTTDRIAIARSPAPPMRSPEIAARERANTRAGHAGAVVELWRPGGPSLRCDGHVGAVTGVAWTPDGTRVVSVSWDRSVRLWNSRDCVQIGHVRGFSGPLWRVAVGPHGRYVAVAAWSGGLKDRATALLHLLYAPRRQATH